MAAAIGEIQTGAARNIAYGNSAPEDTSKLWVKTAEPAAVQVTSKVVVANEELEEFVSAIPAGAGNNSMGTAAVGPKVYLFGGLTASGLDTRQSTIHAFDTENKTIKQLSVTLAQAASYPAAAAVGSKIYIFGGLIGDLASSPKDFQSRIQVFDAESNTIETLDVTLPTANGDMAAAAIGKNVYLFGGYFDQTGIYVFQSESNTISKLSATLSAGARAIAAAAVGSKVYLFGGRVNDEMISTIQVFDAERYTLETLDVTLPTATAHVGAAAVGTKIYLFGGRGALSTIQVFDTESNTLTTLSEALPVALGWIRAETVGTNIYLFGGYAPPVVHSAIHKFSASLPLAEDTILLEASGTKNVFELMPGVELGVANVYLGNAEGLAEKVPAAVYKDGAWVEI